MVCNSCGRSTANENANFCDYCGASYKEVVFIQNEDKYKADSLKESSVVGGVEKESNVVGEQEESISFGNWVGSLLLPFIPLVGPIINLVMMLVWAFGSDTSKTKRNWARASLIVIIVNIVLIVISIVLLIGLFMSSYTELINSGFDMEGYMNQINQMNQSY